MRKEKTRCMNQNETCFCSLNSDNTLTIWEDFWREGGTVASPEYSQNASDYLDKVDTYLSARKQDDKVFYERVMKMLQKNGFNYEPWKAFIRASDTYIWEPVIEMTKEEIEAALGYKIKIKETR